MWLKHLVSQVPVLFLQQSSSHSAQSKLSYKILANILLGQNQRASAAQNFGTT